jgi:hypothetical protein
MLGTKQGANWKGKRKTYLNMNLRNGVTHVKYV